MGLNGKDVVYIDGKVGEVSDGFHSFNELYDHRIALFIVLMKHEKHVSWRSRKHDDGTKTTGWFIAGMKLPTGDITYHLPDKMWQELYGIEELKKAPKWDFHTSKDVVGRLLEWNKFL